MRFKIGVDDSSEKGEKGKFFFAANCGSNQL